MRASTAPSATFKALRAMRWALLLCAATAPAAAQTLRGHWRPEFVAAPYDSPLPGGTPLHLVLGLPLPDPAGLDAFLAQAYAPASPAFHQFLSPEAFAQRFSPSRSDYQAVAAFARAQGFVVGEAWPDRLGVPVDAVAADVERAFHVKLQRRRRADQTLFYAPDREPSVDGRLPLAHISGLDDLRRKRPRARRRDRAAAARAPQPRNGSAGDAAWGPGYYQGWDFRQAYFPDLPANVQGQGQRIGLVEYQGYYQSDINAYCAAQSPPIAVPSITAHPVDGYSTTPVVTPIPAFQQTDPLGDNSEVSLDMEAAIAMAPQASLVVYEGPYNASINDLLAAIVQAPLCRQVSCSWSSDGDATTQALLAQMAAQGQAFVNASGDLGAYGVNNSAGPPSFPDSLSPYITEAGGSALSALGPDGSPHWCTYTSETVWNNFQSNRSCAQLFNSVYSGGASGGGLCDTNMAYNAGTGLGPSDQLALPSWQDGLATAANGGSNQWRMVPDVSINGQGFWVTDNGPVAANANNDVYGGTNHDVLDGTSGAAPLWAGVLALTNQQAVAAGRGPLGCPNPLLYQLARTPTTYAQAFHDIADGSDNGLYDKNSTLCDPLIYKAVTGYDLATGLGSPKGAALINDLVGLLPSPTPTVTATFTISPTFTASPTSTATPTATPTPSSTPTSTISPTFSVSPTITPTPVFLASGLGRCVLAPQPARAGQPLTLYFKAAPSRTRWLVYDLDGEAVGQADIRGSGPHRFATDKLAPGLYFAHIQVDYADGTSETLLLKAAVVR